MSVGWGYDGSMIYIEKDGDRVELTLQDASYVQKFLNRDLERIWVEKQLLNNESYYQPDNTDL